MQSLMDSLPLAGSFIIFAAWDRGAEFYLLVAVAVAVDVEFGGGGCGGCAVW